MRVGKDPRIVSILAEHNSTVGQKPDKRFYMKCVECAPQHVVEQMEKQYEKDLAEWEAKFKSSWEAAAKSFE